jgi:hypothetical protein
MLTYNNAHYAMRKILLDIEFLTAMTPNPMELFKQDHCPIDFDGKHFENAQILDGLLSISWKCPFCGFNVG